MCDISILPPSTRSAVDEPALANAAPLTPEYTSQPAQAVTEDNDRKRKERGDTTEPESLGKKPRADTPELKDEGGPSERMEDGSEAVTEPSEKTEGKEKNVDVTADHDGTITAPENDLSFLEASLDRIAAAMPSPTSIFRTHLSSLHDSKLNDEDEEFDRFMVRPEMLTATFEDVYASRDTINSLRLATLPLRDPMAFQVGILSRHASFGVLLYGPPGTGKTMLARALAKEAGVKMIAISYADIESRYVGEAEKKIKSLFRYAQLHHPCIIFIDEADSCFRSRSAAGTPSYHISFLNQFLTEMDGIGNQVSRKPIVVASTNRPFDMDEGILRRLGRRILVDVPDVHGRASILKLHLAGEQQHPDLDLGELARHTHDFTGADLADLVFHAAVEAVQEMHGEKDEPAGDDRPGEKKSGADRVMRRAHFLSARKSVSPAPKADLVAKIAEFHARYGSLGGGKGNSSSYKQSHEKTRK